MTGFSHLESSIPVALIVHQVTYSLTPNTFYLGNDRRGCGFLFRLGLFTDFIGSDYGSTFIQTQASSSESCNFWQGRTRALNFVPRFCNSSMFILWLFPKTPGAVSLELSQWHCTGYGQGRKTAESLGHNRQRPWLNI